MSGLEIRQLQTTPPKIVLVYEYERAPYLGFAPNDLSREQREEAVENVTRWLREAHPGHVELLLQILELIERGETATPAD